MNQPVRKSGHFKDYFETGNDRKRLTGVLLLIAMLVCPVFAYLFKSVEAPESIFWCILSGTVVFPAIILLEKNVRPLQGKLPILYFAYFISGKEEIDFAIFEIKESDLLFGTKKNERNKRIYRKLY